MRSLCTSTVCRTVVVLGYLSALALAGARSAATLAAALALVAVWAAPLVVAHGHRAAVWPVVVPARATQPGEAGAG